MLNGTRVWWIYMRKKVFGRQLSRSSTTRRALYRTLVSALVMSESIKTTKAKAKSVQGFIDKLVTTAKKDDLVSRRRLMAILGNDRKTVDALCERVRETTNGVTSGFTRIIPLPRRRGDLAEVVRLEWTHKLTKKEEKNGKKESTKKDEKKADVKKKNTKAGVSKTKSQTKK